MTGIILALFGIAIAIVIPLGVEWSRRPQLRIERGDDVNQRVVNPAWRLVHVKVINPPLRGPFARFMLRAPATACRVSITFTSHSDHGAVHMAGRWAATPEPRSVIGGLPEVPMEYYALDPERAGVPSSEFAFDPTKVPQTLRLDLSADDAGEVVPVAIKFRGEARAFGFTSESYGFAGFRNPELALEDEEYEVMVIAAAGGIEQQQKFLLRNAGEAETDLRLE